LKPADNEDPLLALARRIDKAPVREVHRSEFIIDEQHQCRVLGVYEPAVSTLAFQIEHGTIMESIALAEFGGTLFLSNGFNRCAAMKQVKKGNDWTVQARIVPVRNLDEIKTIGHLLNTREQLKLTAEDKRASFNHIVGVLGYHRMGDGSFIGWRK